jgi:hypothetical protein
MTQLAWVTLDESRMNAMTEAQWLTFVEQLNDVYQTPSGEVYASGSAGGEVYATGSRQGDMYVTGQVKGEAYSPGATKTDAYATGLIKGQVV